MASDKFVSRGGEKLQAALDKFEVDIKDKVILDIGCSTGGFVDCLLQNKAKKVYAVDTAYGELAWKLRNDPRVVVMERTNILYLRSLPSVVIPAKAGIYKEWIPDQVRDDDTKVDIVTIDAGWTKLELVLPVVRSFLKPGGLIIALLKPHYEGDKRSLVKGVVKPELVEGIKNQTMKNIENLGFKVKQVMDSPILGGAGNKEFFLYIKAD